MTELKKKAHKSWENDTTVSGASMPNKIYEAGYIAGATETTKELQEEVATLKHNKKTVAHLSSCISDVQEKKIAELELEIKKLTQHLEPQLMTDLLKQVREEVEQEQRITELEAQIEKMKCCGNCKQRELIRERGQWKERFNCKGNGCLCHSKWEIKENG